VTPLTDSSPAVVDAYGHQEALFAGEIMNTARRAVVTTAIAAIAISQMFFIASSALAKDLVGKTDVTFEWTAATGPVFEYAVFVDRNGAGYPGSPEQIVTSTKVDLSGAYGDSLMVRVAARDDLGNQGPFSLDSEILYFVAPTPAPAPELSLSSSLLTSEAPLGENPANQSFTIQNSGGSTLEYSIVTDKSWFAVNPVSGTTTTETDTISVSIDAASRPPAGIHIGKITVNATGLAPQIILLEHTVTNSVGVLSLDKNFIRTQVTQGFDATDQSFVVGNIGGANLSYTVNSDANWATVSPGSGTLSPSATQSIAIGLQASSLAAGTYTATITVTMVGGANTPQLLTLSLVVTHPLGVPGRPVALIEF
jgi:predicted secreted protein